MDNQWLYQQYDGISALGMLQEEMPLYVKDNLNPYFELRPYQIEAFSRFFHYFTKYPNKDYPVHLLFNMATGSGKTLIMAGLILYLYEKGYRNFIFFVNSSNIIEKTKNNFLNPLSNKYQFAQSLSVNNSRVQIHQVDNFEASDKENINIVFTTIQGLHADLHAEKENALTYEDFKDKKIVLLADEAHHMNVQTRNRQKEELFEKPNWENTVENILSKNKDNLLLEFTATLDFLDRNIEDKYKRKIIYKYDLKEFRNDGYSKDVKLVQAQMDEKERIIQAIVLSQYRQEVASSHGINLKPVILFKAQRTIAESEQNKENFHTIIDELSENDIDKLKKQTDIPIIQRAFEFLKEKNITDEVLVRKLKVNFAENKCISVNSESEKVDYQILVNSLEDKDNQIRAIFAVEKLNEGWDVLNLFDIVRLYETRDARHGIPGKTTIAEAQLIGRGARYYPFTVQADQDKFIRKYDNDLDNELRILEELHYHSIYDVRYISEITRALSNIGMIDENIVELPLKLKDTFKQESLFKEGQIYLNKQVKNDYKGIKSFSDIGVSKRNFKYEILSGKGSDTGVFSEDGNLNESTTPKSLDISLKDIPKAVIRKALYKNLFFSFSTIKHYFPHVQSSSEFIENKEYLGGLSITFTGTPKQLENIPREDMLNAVLGLLSEIEKDLKLETYEKVGTDEFYPSAIEKIFTDKSIKIDKNSERADGQEGFVQDREWYVYSANYGTSEEKDFVRLLDRQIEILSKKYKDIFLIRNERQFKIYNFTDGQPFEPDYVLYMKEKKTDKPLTLQIFVEPKGKHLQATDQWKEDFLKEIKERFKDKVLKFTENRQYRIIGVPFYNVDDENKFKEEFEGVV